MQFPVFTIESLGTTPDTIEATHTRFASSAVVGRSSSGSPEFDGSITRRGLNQ
ncbi:MAG: hypothetical protein M3464_11880 [Chloroflexota bacterium]|nr:hypothetical protein [Chloroflexota bacterium]